MSTYYSIPKDFKDMYSYTYTTSNTSQPTEHFTTITLHQDCPCIIRSPNKLIESLNNLEYCKQAKIEKEELSPTPEKPRTRYIKIRKRK